MKITRAERIMAYILAVLLCVGGAVFFGYPALIAFGVIKYDAIMSQPADQVAHVELLEERNGEYVVLADISGESLDSFMEDYLSFEFRRYTNDPASHPGPRVIKICYADGGYDLVGRIIDFYNCDGQRVSTKGWYYLSNPNITYLFEKYCIESSK